MELFKKSIKMLLASKQIFFTEVTYYPPLVLKFERNFAKYIGKRHGLTFCNGTSSIEAALFALGIDKGDEVIVPSCTFHASIDPILNLGAVPVFVDIDTVSGSILISDLIDKISLNTKCIIVVHLFGNAANIGSISALAKSKKIVVLEDVSHAHGALYEGKKVGSFGDISCFSLQGAKAISAGEGGIALTDDERLLSLMSMYGHFGRHKHLFRAENMKYQYTGVGHKLRANPLGIGMASIDLIFNDFYNKKARKNKTIFDKIFKNVEGITVMASSQDGQSGGFFGGLPILIDPMLYSIDEVLGTFTNYGINVNRYPYQLHHKMEIYNYNRDSTLINTEYLEKNLILIDRRLLFFLPFTMKYALRKVIKELSRISL